jgi:hypothetical protein
MKIETDMDGICQLEGAADALMQLAGRYPHPATKLALINAAAIIYRHAYEAEKALREEETLP